MKAKELNLVELLDFEPAQGRIRFKDHRMLLWDADAFGNLRKELIESLGLEPARGILSRFGFANGYRDALSTRELSSWENDAEWWLTCPALQTHEGKVRPEVQRLELDRARGVFEMEVVWKNSYEAAQHLRVFGKPAEPVCWTLAGYASGFSTACFGEEVFVVEEECAAMGGEACHVVGRTRRAWGEAGATYAAEYEARAIAKELEELEEELRRKAREVSRKERELRKLRGDPADGAARGGIVTRSRDMEKVLELAAKVSQVDATVLVTGESGVGKERVARYIHDTSPRAKGELIAVNCGALPETLLESELFGHARGAFTGAVADKKGLFEAARGGTIFLDEIGETTPATQVKLLRVLQEREVRPVGSTVSHAVDARVIAATNRDLEAMVASGAFRKDLYYRLKVVMIAVPPLRQRREDILPLAREFIGRTCRAYGTAVKTLSPEAAHALTSYAWPGNVRELENAVEHAVVVSDTGGKVQEGDLPPEVRGLGKDAAAVLLDEAITLAELERRYTLRVLEQNRWNRTLTARALGIGANTLWRKLKQWGVPSAGVA
jgi:DNA-binding NtrC family response regulator